MMCRNRVLAAVMIGTVWMTTLAAQTASSIVYPPDFKSWAFVKTGPSAARGGIHHIYANDKAVEGYRSGRFPEGAVLVFEIVGTSQADGRTVEGPRTLIDVMVKNAQTFASTGGWGFEEFLGATPTSNGALNDQARTACFTCHIGQKDRDYVFSALMK